MWKSKIQVKSPPAGILKPLGERAADTPERRLITLLNSPQKAIQNLIILCFRLFWRYRREFQFESPNLASKGEIQGLSRHT